MSNLSQIIRVVLFFAFGLVLIWMVHETFTDSTFYTQRGYEVIANFADLKQLKVGSDVRMAGVSVGIVKNATLKDLKASITITIDKKIKIPSDSIAKVSTSGLLGNNYVAIDPGTSTTYLPYKKAVIQTIEVPGISDLVAHINSIGTKIETILDGFQGGDSGKGGGLFGSLNQLIAENKDKFSNVLANLEKITAKLASAEGSLGRIIYSDDLYNNVATTVTDIREAAQKVSGLMTNAESILDQIKKKDKSPLGVLIGDEKMAHEMQSVVNNLYQFSEKLNSDKSTLGHLIGSDDLYVRAKDIMHKVDNAVNSLENSGPTTAVGIVGSALF